MQIASKKFNLSNMLNSAILLLIPLFAYISAYLSQASYLNYYGIDQDSVQLSIELMIKTASFLLLTILAASIIAFPLVDVILRRSQSSQKFALVDLVVSIFLETLILFLAFKIADQLSKNSGIAIFEKSENWLVITIVLLVPLFSSLALIFNNDGFRRKTFKKSFLKASKAYFDKHLIYLKAELSILILLLCALFSSAIGNKIAETRDIYKILPGSKVVIIEQNSRLIVSDYRNDNLTGKFQYIYLGSSGAIDFEEKPIKINKVD